MLRPHALFARLDHAVAALAHPPKPAIAFALAFSHPDRAQGRPRPSNERRDGDRRRSLDRLDGRACPRESGGRGAASIRSTDAASIASTGAGSIVNITQTSPNIFTYDDLNNTVQQRLTRAWTHNARPAMAE